MLVKYKYLCTYICKLICKLFYMCNDIYICKEIRLCLVSTAFYSNDVSVSCLWYPHKQLPLSMTFFVSRETKRKRELSLIGTSKIRKLMDKGKEELKISWVWNEEQLHRKWNNLFYPS